MYLILMVTNCSGGHGVEVFSIILLPRGLHSPKSGTVYNGQHNVMLSFQRV